METIGKELAQRQTDNVLVRLWWFNFGGRDELTVTVRDLRTDENFTINPPPDKALDCFEHPFAYRKA